MKNKEEIKIANLCFIDNREVVFDKSEFRIKEQKVMKFFDEQIEYIERKEVPVSKYFYVHNIDGSKNYFKATRFQCYENTSRISIQKLSKFGSWDNQLGIIFVKDEVLYPERNLYFQYDKSEVEWIDFVESMIFEDEINGEVI